METNGDYILVAVTALTASDSANVTDPKPEKEYHEISSFHLYVADSDREVELLLRAFLLKLSPLTMELTAYL